MAQIGPNESGSGDGGTPPPPVSEFIEVDKAGPSLVSPGERPGLWGGSMEDIIVMFPGSH